MYVYGEIRCYKCGTLLITQDHRQYTQANKNIMAPTVMVVKCPKCVAHPKKIKS